MPLRSRFHHFFALSVGLLALFFAPGLHAQQTPEQPTRPETPQVGDDAARVAEDAAEVAEDVATESSSDGVVEVNEEDEEDADELEDENDEEEEEDERVDDERTEVVGTIATVEPSSSPTSDSRVRVAWNSSQPEYDKRYLWNLTIGGYVRVAYTGIEDDPNNENVGRNDGFSVQNARLTFKGNMRRELGFKLQLDGAIDRQLSGADRPVFEVDTRLRDAKIWWEPIRYVRFTAGQQKPAFDVEERFATDELLFVNRSVGSRGILGVEGDNVDGLSRAREVGAMLSMRPLFFGEDPDEAEGVGVAYYLAATNGITGNFSLNDNDQLAYYGRLELFWSEMVRLGGAAYLNDETEDFQEAESTGRESLGFTGDLTLKAAGLTVIGSYTQVDYTFDAIEVQPGFTSTAYQAQLAYQEPFLGFQPAYRFAYYDRGEFENDAQTHHTIGLNYNPRYPIKLMVNYTITAEEAPRELENDRFEVLLQASW